mmetsp:Transcript_13333/g.39663  ORF Transcript_13333/g.39663 Transcript_13333/m.39663 type:complete len:387 (-) Transcript_13333:365-1525(-)
MGRYDVSDPDVVDPAPPGARMPGFPACFPPIAEPQRAVSRKRRGLKPRRAAWPTKAPLPAVSPTWVSPAWVPLGSVFDDFDPELIARRKAERRERNLGMLTDRIHHFEALQARRRDGVYGQESPFTALIKQRAREEFERERQRKENELRLARVKELAARAMAGSRRETLVRWRQYTKIERICRRFLKTSTGALAVTVMKKWRKFAEHSKVVKARFAGKLAAINLRVFQAWKLWTEKNRRVKRFFTKHVVGIKATCFDGWAAFSRRQKKIRAFTARHFVDIRLVTFMAWKNDVRRTLGLKRKILGLNQRSERRALMAWRDYTKASKFAQKLLFGHAMTLREPIFKAWRDWARESAAERAMREGLMFKPSDFFTHYHTEQLANTPTRY